MPLVGMAHGTVVYLRCLPMWDRGLEVSALPPPGPYIPWMRLMHGAVEATEGHAAICLLEREAEASAVPLEAARHLVLPSTSRPVLALPSASRTG